ncbi:hypothetical protein ACQJBY_006230 [Aegilops geniculata]
MGNSFTTRSASPAPLGKTHDPCFKWKIHDFSVLLERGAIPTNSALFHSFGHKWFLRVTPSHTKSFAVPPYVALSLGLSVGSLDLEPDYTVEAMFVLAIYNHSNGLYYGSEASHMFHINNTNSTLEHLIPLKELLKSPGFLAGDCCVFGVEILKVDVFPHEKEAVVVQKKAPTVQNLFIQKNGFVTRNCTLTMSNFLELNLKHFVRSAMFEIDGHKWYLGIYPRGDQYSTSYLSLYLCMDASYKLPPESGKLVELSLSIMDQKHGQHYTRKSPALVVFAGECRWGWSNFIPLSIFRDPSSGYLVRSCCIVKAEITIVGSSSGGEVLADGQMN